VDDWESLNAAGVKHYASREFSLAYESFRKAVDADGSQAIAYYNLGMTSRTLGREEEALSLLETYDRLCRESCPYFPDHKRGGLEAYPCAALSLADFDGMLRLGFRRTGDTVSRNVCPDCSECVQVRVPLADFRPSRGQRRVLAKNRDMSVRTSEFPVPDESRAALMAKYMTVRHGWPRQDFGSELVSYYSGWRRSFELSYWLGERLAMVAILDSGERDLYASACFFDPDLSRRSPGIFNLLQAFAWGAERGYRFLYMGERIEGKSNMRYKSAFLPCQALEDGAWTGKGTPS
jgi:arginine-tRNA-protein transferase